MELIFFLILFILIYPINKFIQNLNFLPSQTGETHQNFLGKKNVPLSGGLFILIFIIFLYKNNIYLSISFLIFFFLGLCVDKKIIISPSKRFILQMLFIISFVLFFNLEVTDLRNPFLSSLLENKLISYFFIIICFLVLINGSNFIDGLNSLLIVYYILVLLSIIGLTKYHLIIFDLNYIINLTLILSVILIFNLLNKSFLGDSGAYSISCLVGYLSINYFKTVQDLSVLFVVIILWYPAFENLFSILRRIYKKGKVSNPDNLHFHALIYLKMKNKFSKLNANNLSTLLVLLLSIPGFILSNLFHYQSLILGLIIFGNVLVYLSIYYLLKK